MTPLDDTEKDKLFKVLDEQTAQLRRLERGMYGDSENGVKGVIERLTSIEKWITNSKLKIAYVSGVVVAVGIGLKMFWEWLTGTHK